MDIKEGRYFLRNKVWDEDSKNNQPSDQRKGMKQPSLEKPWPEDAELIKLPLPNKGELKKQSIFDIFNDRKSRRVFQDISIGLEELSFLLWACQGVKKVLPNNYATMRTVPSAGARHPFETYLFIKKVEGLEPGLYRYLAIEHSLILLKKGVFEEQLSEANLDQHFVGSAPVTFVWTAIPYRTEWRYKYTAHKVIALDAGHVMQNLYLACEALELGTCAIGAYSDKKMNTLVDVDGEDEFVIYVAPVGKPVEENK